MARSFAWIIRRRSQPDSAELRAVVIGVLATPKCRERESSAVGRTCLFATGTAASTTFRVTSRPILRTTSVNGLK